MHSWTAFKLNFEEIFLGGQKCSWIDQNLMRHRPLQRYEGCLQEKNRKRPWDMKREGSVQVTDGKWVKYKTTMSSIAYVG